MENKRKPARNKTKNFINWGEEQAEGRHNASERGQGEESICNPGINPARTKVKLNPSRGVCRPLPPPTQNFPARLPDFPPRRRLGWAGKLGRIIYRVRNGRFWRSK